MQLLIVLRHLKTGAFLCGGMLYFIICALAVQILGSLWSLTLGCYWRTRQNPALLISYPFNWGMRLIYWGMGIRCRPPMLDLDHGIHEDDTVFVIGAHTTVAATPYFYGLLVDYFGFPLKIVGKDAPWWDYIGLAINVLRSMGAAISIKRTPDARERDLSAIREMTIGLESGDRALLFPDGHRPTRKRLAETQRYLEQKGWYRFADAIRHTCMPKAGGFRQMCLALHELRRRGHQVRVVLAVATATVQEHSLVDVFRLPGHEFTCIFKEIDLPPVETLENDRKLQWYLLTLWADVVNPLIARQRGLPDAVTKVA